MQEFELVVSFINTCGFPIACVLLLAYYVKNLNESHQKEVKNLSEKIDKICVAVQELTSELSKALIIDKLDSEDK